MLQARADRFLASRCVRSRSRRSGWMSAPSKPPTPTLAAFGRARCAVSILPRESLAFRVLGLSRMSGEAVNEARRLRGGGLRFDTRGDSPAEGDAFRGPLPRSHTPSDRAEPLLMAEDSRA